MIESKRPVTEFGDKALQTELIVREFPQEIITIFMKLQFWSAGKSHESYVKKVELFTKRICHYYAADWQIIAPQKCRLISSEDLKRKKVKLF